MLGRQSLFAEECHLGQFTSLTRVDRVLSRIMSLVRIFTSWPFFKRKFKSLSNLALLLVTSIIATLSASGSSAAENVFSGSDIQELVGSYCVVCHSDTAMIAGMSLEHIDFARPGSHAEILEKMASKLRARMMPPSGMPRPELEVIDQMVNWLETELDQAWAENPNPGRMVPIHRMNRYEYNNAVNELLGLDVNVISLLPGDPTADGHFDNIAESLPFSTAYLERYMSVARTVTRMTTGLPPVAPSFTTYEVPLHLVQDWRQNEEVPFGTRGGLSAAHNFPVDGEYLFRIRLRANWQDFIMGLGWPQQLEVRLDGRLLKRFTIGGEAPGIPAAISFSGLATPGEQGSTDWATYMQTADEELEFLLPVEAGVGVVTVSYIREHLEAENRPQPILKGRLLANDEVYLSYQQVHSLEIGGPYGDSGSTTSTSGRAKIFSCHPMDESTNEIACATDILSKLARRAYRQPLSEGDLETVMGFYNQGRLAGGSFDTGIQFALEYLLSDPGFLIRTYRGTDDQISSDEQFPLSDLELASRLSFFLWSSIPDDSLLEIAEKSELKDVENLQQQVIRMTADPRFVETLVDDFSSQWLNLRRLEDVEVNSLLFPDYDLSLIEAFRIETEMFIANTLRTDASVLELLNADYTFLNERLAQHYEVPGVHGSRFRKVKLPNLEQRGGLLAHGSLLSVTSYPGRTSPVLRGKWLLDNMLGTPPPPPPQNVSNLPEAEIGQAPKSIRDRLEQHRSNPVCASCHTVIDPLGFALENFDVIGGWRTLDEGGIPIDSDGSYPGGIEFKGFSDLRAWMLDRPEQFVHTLTEKLMEYALGRRVEYFDQPTIRHIVDGAAAENYSWSSLIWGIVNSPAFLTNSTRASSGD